ncbi:hypothetical protein FRB99_008702 [Tulasnella sp. 403]|nr:hypothetical protein FRB99_008702 [Tulasnella sp. 403]
MAGLFAAILTNTETTSGCPTLPPATTHSSVGVLPGEVCYLQSQNGNLSETGGDEFQALRQDVPRDVPWASEALDRLPDAVNLWIGDSRSTTSAHSDPYENIYTVIRGRKHFTLLPPTEGWSLQERLYPHATYTRASPTSPLILTPTSPPTHVSWASLDPVRDLHRIRREAEYDVQPLHVSVGPGDALYLPAGWWHHVRQSGDGPDGRGAVIAVNWWYDIEMR